MRRRVHVNIFPKITEEQFQKQILQYAKLMGWRSAHFRPAQTKSGKWVTPVQGDGKGFPDLILLRGNEGIAAELKVGKNSLNEEQEKWQESFYKIPGFRAVVWRPEMWEEIESILRR